MYLADVKCKITGETRGGGILAARVGVVHGNSVFLTGIVCKLTSAQKMHFINYKKASSNYKYTLKASYVMEAAVNGRLLITSLLPSTQHIIRKIMYTHQTVK